jgi:signal transduction histidine kinase
MNDDRSSRKDNRLAPAAPLAAFFSEHFRIAPDPTDVTYQQRQTAEMVDGFRMLSLLVLATMSTMFAVYLLGPASWAPRSREALSLSTCGVLACAGGVGLVAGRYIRSRVAALVGTALLLGASMTVLTVDRLLREQAPGSTLIPTIFIMLTLLAALLPLRPAPVLGFGVMLLVTCGLAARFTLGPFRGDVVEFVSAGMAVAISTLIAARSTRQRIDVHRAHLCALESEREAEGERSRALLAESAVTMERLAASLSHELNTPIGALKSSTDTLTRAVRRYASFPAGSHLPDMVDELSGAITESAARLGETIARIQRFANLDRSAVRLVDVNQLIQDAVALMNPPSATQTQVKLHLEPLPQIWCRPHELSVAIGSVLNDFLENGDAVRIESMTVGTSVAIRLARRAQLASQDLTDPGFAVVGGRVRAAGWGLFTARQLVRRSGGELSLDHDSADEIVLMTIPGDGVLPEACPRGTSATAA